jgi:hypothetical protein
VNPTDAVAVAATLTGLGEQVHVIGQMAERAGGAAVVVQ